MIENIQDKFTPIEKIEIAQKIKPISLEEAETDFINLQKIGTTAETMSPRCRTGNNIVDYFTFVERLNTKGKYDVNFYEFLTHIDEFKKKNLEKINYFLQLISNIHKHNKKIFLEETYIDKKNSFQKKRVLISQSDCNIFYINNTFHDSKFQNQKDHLQYLRELILKNANKFPILIISGDIIFNYFNEEFMEKIKSLPNTVLISDSEKKYTEIIKYNFKEMYI